MVAQHLYAEIAERFTFELPVEYRQMRERGLLTLDRPAASISTRPGDGYLWIPDMEWYSLEQIVAFEFPDSYHPHLPHLVPFAFSGAGDYWCWQTDKHDERGTRVLECFRDTCSALVYAPNFGTALYRQSLGYACNWVERQQSDFAEGRAFLRRWSVDLALALPPSWCQVLAELAERPAVDWSGFGGAHRSLLSFDEMKFIEARDLRFPEIGKEFPWGDLETA